MITVPDQDWMAYGAWLTTPDDAGGTHRIGVFFNGMDPYEGNVAPPPPPSMPSMPPHEAGLRGTATYSGGATGIYVDGTAGSGLFTAEASLTANFDRTSNGTNLPDVDADDDDFMISGRIDNFRGTDGVFLGDDTQADPNHPTAGENDWVVMLRAIPLVETGVLAEGTTSGSADGVSWDGIVERSALRAEHR